MAGLMGFFDSSMALSTAVCTPSMAVDEETVVKNIARRFTGSLR